MNGVGDKCSFVAGTAAEIFGSVSHYPPEQTVLLVDPPRKGCDEVFMQQLLQRVKIMQHQREVPQNVKIPNWPELAVHRVWPHALRLPGVLERLPNEWNGGHRTDKGFFWSTMAGQHPDWVQHLINDCTRQRRIRAAARVLPRQTIQLDAGITEMLLQDEFQIRGR